MAWKAGFPNWNTADLLSTRISTLPVTLLKVNSLWIQAQGKTALNALGIFIK